MKHLANGSHFERIFIQQPTVYTNLSSQELENNFLAVGIPEAKPPSASDAERDAKLVAAYFETLYAIIKNIESVQGDVAKLKTVQVDSGEGLWKKQIPQIAAGDLQLSAFARSAVDTWLRSCDY